MHETSALKKALLIGLKDLRIAARDRAALLLMLAAPFILTLGLGLVTGSFGSSGAGSGAAGGGRAAGLRRALLFGGRSPVPVRVRK